MTSKEFYRIFKDELGYDVKATTGCGDIIDVISKNIIPTLNHYGYTLKKGWESCMIIESLYNCLIPYNDRSISNKIVASASLPSISQGRNRNGSTELSKRTTILQRIDNINESIKQGNRCLSMALKDLDNIKPCINIENHWFGGVKNDTIRESILSTHENLARYIQRCGAAIKNTNENLAHTLDLVQILAVFEADLYRTLNREVESEKNLKEKVEEWCQQSNIKDQMVKELLAVSFEKAKTLRDRLYEIKDELTASINDLDQRFKSDTRFIELNDRLTKRIEEIFSKLNYLSSELDKINKVPNQIKIKNTDNLHGFEQTIMNMQQSINQLETRLSEETQDSKKNKVAVITISAIVAVISSLLTYTVTLFI